MKDWTRLSDVRHGKTAQVWQHTSGHQVRHCGHPTALWPYFGTQPGGGKMILSENGRGFTRLKEAMRAIEKVARGSK